jgi:dihydroanticapsin dehydrogenase
MGAMQDKTAFVTGGASGIGAALVRRLQAEGAVVSVADLHGTPSVDVTDATALKAAIDAAAAPTGRIDLVFSNAGVLTAGTIELMPIEDFDCALAVNLRGAFLTARFALPYLRAAGGGSIIFTASTASFVGARSEAAYDASKAGLLGLMRSLAAEGAADGIRANAVAPGWIDTPFNDPIWDAVGGRVKAEATTMTKVPLSRQGHPEEVVSAMLYLASAEASYITGQTLVIDGGFLAVA